MKAMAMTTDEFDPTRHRVWRVEASIYYTTYVVAETYKDAEEIAGEHEREDRDGRDASFDATEMKAGDVAFDGDILPWGPNQRDGKDLTVNDALAVLAGEPSPPLQLPEKAYVPVPSIAEWLNRAGQKEATP